MKELAQENYSRLILTESDLSKVKAVVEDDSLPKTDPDVETLPNYISFTPKDDESCSTEKRTQNTETESDTPVLTTDSELRSRSAPLLVVTDSTIENTPDDKLLQNDMSHGPGTCNSSSETSGLNHSNPVKSVKAE